jgi:hypothetical protein
LHIAVTVQRAIEIIKYAQPEKVNKTSILPSSIIEAKKESPALNRAKKSMEYIIPQIDNIIGNILTTLTLHGLRSAKSRANIVPKKNNDCIMAKMRLIDSVAHWGWRGWNECSVECLRDFKYNVIILH